MLSSSVLIVILLGIRFHNSWAVVNTQKLCEGQRYGMLVRNPEDCNSYFVCQFIVKLQKCSPGLHFDRKLRVCNWPKYADCDWVEQPDESDGATVSVTPQTPSRYPPGYPTVDDVITDKPSSDRPGYPTVDDVITHEPSSHRPGYPTIDDVITDEPSSHRPGYPTVDDVITDEPPSHRPGYPTIDDVITDQPSSHRPGYPTVDDVITDEPSSHRPGYPTVDGVITDEPSSHRPGYPTVDDVITDEPISHNPGYPTIDDVITSKPSSHRPGYPTIDDVITDEPSSHRPGYPTVDDVITDEPSSHRPGYPTVDDVITDEPISNSPGYPTIDDVVTEQPSPPTPTIDDVFTHSPVELPTEDGDYPSHHWNLIASILSVESSPSAGFINHPTAGAHSPETGHPVNVMTGYDPKNVQCLYNGFYFLPHPTSCQKYFICAYRHLHTHSCGNGVMWNHKKAECEINAQAKCYSRDVGSEQSTERVTPSIDYETDEPIKRPTRPNHTEHTTQHQPKQPRCPSMRQAYLPHTDDCQKYYICIVGKPVLTSCPSGMHWDAIREFCGKPEQVHCSHHR